MRRMTAEDVLQRKIPASGGQWDMISTMSFEMVCEMAGASTVEGFLESLNGKLIQINKA